MNETEMAYNQNGRLRVDIGYPIYECNKRFVYIKFVLVNKGTFNRTNTDVYSVSLFLICHQLYSVFIFV